MKAMRREKQLRSGELRRWAREIVTVGSLISSPLFRQINAFLAARHLSHSGVILKFRMFVLVWASSLPRVSYAGRDLRPQPWYLTLLGSDCFNVARVVPRQRHWSFFHCSNRTVERFQAPRLWGRTFISQSVGILPPSLELSYQHVKSHERGNGHDTSDAAFVLPEYGRHPKVTWVIRAAAPKGRAPRSRLTIGQLCPRIFKSDPLRCGVFWTRLDKQRNRTTKMI